MQFLVLSIFAASLLAAPTFASGGKVTKQDLKMFEQAASTYVDRHSSCNLETFWYIGSYDNRN